MSHICKHARQIGLTVLENPCADKPIHWVKGRDVFIGDARPTRLIANAGIRLQVPCAALAWGRLLSRSNKKKFVCVGSSAWP